MHLPFLGAVEAAVALPCLPEVAGVVALLFLVAAVQVGEVHPSLLVAVEVDQRVVATTLRVAVAGHLVLVVELFLQVEGEGVQKVAVGL